MTNKEAAEFIKSDLACFKGEDDLSGIKSREEAEDYVNKTIYAFELAIEVLERKECNDCISIEDAKEIIAETDITDGTEPVFSGKQVISLLNDLPRVEPFIDIPY